MKVNIIKRCIDNKIGLLAPGEREVPDSVAAHLIKEGKAVEVKVAETKPAAPQTQPKPQADTKPTDQSVTAEKDQKSEEVKK
jgi:hypothetical protein